MVDVADGRKLVIFTNSQPFISLEPMLIDAEVDAANQKSFIPSEESMNARNALIDALSTQFFSRRDVGLAVAEYRALYKLGRTWLKIAQIIADCLGYSSLKSLDTLIEDAERTKDLDLKTLAALFRRGIDPAATKYAALVEALPKPDPQQTPEAFDQAVQDAVEEFNKTRTRAAKKKAKVPPKAESVEALSGQITEQIREFVVGLSGADRQGKIDQILKTIRETLEKEPGQSDSGHGNPHEEHRPTPEPFHGPAIVRRVAGPTGGPGKSIRRIPKTAPPGPDHPWGDEPLHCLSIGVNSEGAGEHVWNREKYKEILQDTIPKRFLVTGKVDLFGPTVDISAIEEHFDFFRHASQHVFQIPIWNLKRLAELQLRFNTKNHGRWPRNVWMGATVLNESENQLELIKTLGLYNVENRWVSFLPFKSELYSSAHRKPEETLRLAEILRSAGIKWVVLGGDIGTGEGKLTAADAKHIFSASREAGCKFFFTLPETLEAFGKSDASMPSTAEMIARLGLSDQELINVLNTRELPEFQKPTAARASASPTTPDPSAPTPPSPDPTGRKDEQESQKLAG